MIYQCFDVILLAVILAVYPCECLRFGQSRQRLDHMGNRFTLTCLGLQNSAKAMPIHARSDWLAGPALLVPKPMDERRHDVTT